MKCNKVFIIATAAVMIAQNILAQDDMYFTPRKKAQGATTVTSQVVDDDAPYRYRIPADAADGETVDYGNSDRDVDEYNRRGMVLNGISISNNDGPAINNQCGKALYMNHAEIGSHYLLIYQPTLFRQTDTQIRHEV